MTTVARAAQQLVVKDWLPDQLANSSHGHWATRQKKLKVAQTMVWASAKYAGWVRIQGKARLTITLVFPVQRRRDTDNLHSRVKGVIDGLKPWIIDDSTEWLELIVKAEVRPGQKATELLLEPLG